MGWADLQRYWDVYVVPDVSEYIKAEMALSSSNVKGDGSDEDEICRSALRAAKHAIVGLNQFFDYVFENLSPDDPKLQGSRRVEDLRRNLINHAHSSYDRNDLRIIHDLADMHKHAMTRLEVRRHQVSSRSAEWGALPWGEFKFDGSPQIIVDLIGGQQRGLYRVIEGAFEWWITYFDGRLDRGSVRFR